ncbi:MAG TPA: methyltransferase domain-containing protein [Bryobacteraceae bacterium]|nr:methyltransferase domain-containing protein [Bryobacteraceae bacterium]
MADSNVADRMRQEWNQRAREDPHYYVAFGRREQDDAEFFATAADVLRGLRGEIKRLPPAGRREALEIGCGPGRLMRPLAADFAHIHGVDVSDEMIRLAEEKLRGVPNAHPRHAPESNLAAYADESFDFVYSYAVFQHIPSREVVLGYLAEARRVLRPGGILRCQINGLPESSARYTTWEGVRIQAAEVAAFAWRHDFQLLALEGAATQYMWTTWRKQPTGWRASLRPEAAPGTRIRAISNALTGDPLVPASGPRAFAALRLEHLPGGADLLNLEVRIGGVPGALSYLGPPEWDGVVQLNVGVPAGTRTGLVPVELLWLGRPLAEAAWMRVIPPGPLVPRLLSVRDGVNLLSGTRIVSRWIKLVIEELAHPERLQARVDEWPLGDLDIFCTGPLEQRYEINARLPDAVPAGPHQLQVRAGPRPFPPVAIEVA